MAEEKTPLQWYAIVKAISLPFDEPRTADGPWSIKAYVSAFGASPGPFSIEPLDDEGPEFAKLTSSTFDGFTDYVAVLRDAQKWVEMITGSMKINQNPSKLEIVNIVGIFADRTTQKYPPFGRFPTSLRIGLSTAALKEGASPRPSFELSVVLFAHRSGNTLVGNVLRYFARSPDWFDLYSIMQIVRLDLNKTGGKKAGDMFICNRKWAEADELDAFNRTAQRYRHPLVPLPKRPMDLIDARRLVGRIVEQWIIEVSKRPR